MNQRDKCRCISAFTYPTSPLRLMPPALAAEREVTFEVVYFPFARVRHI